mmetsp:Transcript_26731/g.73709  ORF Transcript_26731/g.73709 Transcript_26731/m.73709 type:complete len:232 (+) Transcript_26731:1000-1695(+)
MVVFKSDSKSIPTVLCEKAVTVVLVTNGNSGMLRFCCCSCRCWRKNPCGRSAEPSMRRSSVVNQAISSLSSAFHPTIGPGQLLVVAKYSFINSTMSFSNSSLCGGDMGTVTFISITTTSPARGTCVSDVVSAGAGVGGPVTAAQAQAWKIAEFWRSEHSSGASSPSSPCCLNCEQDVPLYSARMLPTAKPSPQMLHGSCSPAALTSPVVHWRATTTASSSHDDAPILRCLP